MTPNDHVFLAILAISTLILAVVQAAVVIAGFVLAKRFTDAFSKIDLRWSCTVQADRCRLRPISLVSSP